jgi:hypothetical protein
MKIKLIENFNDKNVRTSGLDSKMYHSLLNGKEVEVDKIPTQLVGYVTVKKLSNSKEKKG